MKKYGFTITLVVVLVVVLAVGIIVIVECINGNISRDKDTAAIIGFLTFVGMSIGVSLLVPALVKKNRKRKVENMVSKLTEKQKIERLETIEFFISKMQYEKYRTLLECGNGDDTSETRERLEAMDYATLIAKRNLSKQIDQDIEIEHKRAVEMTNARTKEIAKKGGDHTCNWCGKNYYRPSGFVPYNDMDYCSNKCEVAHKKQRGY